MIVTLTDHTIDPEFKIGLASAKCYDAKTDRQSNIKRAAHCKSVGHLATMRFAWATFDISGISRICSHQLVRIAHAGILQESQRYVAQSDIQFVIPESIKSLDKSLQDRWLNHLEESQQIYDDCLRNGVKKEDARYIIAQSCTTQLSLCMNFQGFQDFLKNRTSKTAQWEIREVAIKMEKLLHDIAPNIF
jgi:thymidylate synthase (FAD)